jgi:hypothetical protein
MTVKIKVINNKNQNTGGIFEVRCVWWKNNGYKLLIYLGLRKTVDVKMLDKYIIIIHAWYAFSSFEMHSVMDSTDEQHKKIIL